VSKKYDCQGDLLDFTIILQLVLNHEMSQHAYQYSIHCLSDGSDYTDVTLLLTIERGTTFCQRYAISGMTTMAARLAADQRIPLHSIRACFGNGLPSILLALSEVGVAEVTWCGFTVDTQHAEELVSATLGSRRQYPLVRTCQVPTDGIWYQLYDDNYVRAHGKYVGGQIVWIYSLLKYRVRAEGDVDTNTSFSIALIPPTMDINYLHPLPENIELMCHIFLRKSKDDVNLDKTRYFYTNPSASNDRILKRATKQAQKLNSILPFLIPFRKSSRNCPHPMQLYPASSLCLNTWKIQDTTIAHESNYKLSNAHSILDENLSLQNQKDSHIPRELIEKVRSIWVAKSQRDENEIDIDDDEEEDSKNEHFDNDTPKPLLVPHLLVLGTGCATPSASRGSSGYAILTPNENYASSLKLTAILDCGEGTLTNLYRHLPSCGGSVNEQLTHLKVIWISHAHLDHFGGLFDVLRACYEARKREYAVSNKRQKADVQATSFVYSQVRSCCMLVPNNWRDNDIPVVIAPVKVLKFLRACCDGLPPEEKQMYYHGISHRGWRLGDNCMAQNWLQDTLPFTLNSYPVNHGGEAHGVQLDFHEPHKFCLAYSGDTRPCCPISPSSTRMHQQSNVLRHPIRLGDRRQYQGRPFGNVSLLLHEATFEDEDHAMAIEKRHSTISEAIHVAQQVSAKACLLTHFSQRYSKSSCIMQETIALEESKTNLRAAFAIDGFLVPLTDDAMTQLPAASYLLQLVLQEYHKETECSDSMKKEI
jgi:ribonuclease BN (tRNA processing enzyme)